MNWFKCNIKVGKTDCLEFIQAMNLTHARLQICIKYGETTSNNAHIIDLGTPQFKAFNVEIHLKSSVVNRTVLAIEKQQIQTNIYKEFRKKEIKKLIINGKDEYGGP